jgi:hypothetical protein
MSEDYEFSLHPISFFGLSWDCPPLKDKNQLPPFNAYSLPNTVSLCHEFNFTKVAMGWHEAGLGFQILVNQSYTKSFFPEVQKGDSVELFIDTRDMKSAGFNTRFCHHFYFLPKEADDHLAGEITHFRTEDSHPLCDPKLLVCQTKLTSNSYVMQIFIPKECLHGYEPSQFDRLGFTYRINRMNDESQHFSVTSEEFPIDQQPALWASIKLSKDSSV